MTPAQREALAAAVRYLRCGSDEERAREILGGAQDVAEAIGKERLAMIRRRQDGKPYSVHRLAKMIAELRRDPADPVQIKRHLRLVRSVQIL